MKQILPLLALLAALALPAAVRSQTLQYLGDGDNRVLGTLQPDGEIFITCVAKAKLHLPDHPKWHLTDAPHAHCTSRMRIDSAEPDPAADDDEAADKAAAAKERALIRKMLAAEKDDDDQH